MIFSRSSLKGQKSLHAIFEFYSSQLFLFERKSCKKKQKNVPFYRLVSAGKNPKASASPAVTLNAFGGTARRRGHFTGSLRSANAL